MGFGIFSAGVIDCNFAGFDLAGEEKWSDPRGMAAPATSDTGYQLAELVSGLQHRRGGRQPIARDTQWTSQLCGRRPLLGITITGIAESLSSAAWLLPVKGPKGTRIM